MRTLRPSSAILLFSAALSSIAGCTPEEPKDTASPDTDSADTSSDTDTAPAPVDADADGFTVNDGDCDDADAARYPGRGEDCNGLDDNCDDRVDEGFLDRDADGTPDCLDAETCDGVDNDGDGAIDEDSVDTDADGVADCVDVEACDSVDNDGDGAVDEGFDADGDGYAACAECDDADATVYPGAGEPGDGRDHDCDGLVDDDLWRAGDLTLTEVMANPQDLGDPVGEWVEVINTSGRDLVLDGVTLWSGSDRATVPDGVLLADGERLVIGGSDEVWMDVAWSGLSLGNGVDGIEVYAGGVALDALAWDGSTLEAPEGASLSLDPWYRTADENDDPARWCAATVPWRALGALDAGSPGADNEPCATLDHDGDAMTIAAGDCDDADVDTFLGAPDAWYDGRDTDCDGWSDYDADRDGFDAAAFDGGDCDDAVAAVNPAAPEICDAADTDEDCDGAADDLDADPTDAVTWYADTDGDGYGDTSTSTAYCDPPGGWVAVDADCDDASAEVNPGETEVCGNGADDDCDGAATGCGIAGEMDVDDAGVVITGVSSNTSLGGAVAFAGDLDGDGTNDLLIGASGTSLAGRGAGAAQVFLGGLSGSLTARDSDLLLTGESVMDAAGSDVDGVGDVDGDGVVDLLVGAPADDTTATDAGAAYLVSGDLSGTVSLSARTAILVGSAASEQAGGYDNAALGDVDADGLADLAIGAPGADRGGVDAGVVYLVYGGALSGTYALSGADALLVGEDAGDQAGSDVCPAGDLDADGIDDLIVMAPSDDDGGSDAGAAYVVYLPVSGTIDLSAADVKITGPSAGAALSTCGGLADVDGDGRDDFAVGASAASGSAGAAFVFIDVPAGSARASSADVTITGIASGDGAGASLSAAGDTDGDGLNELLIGASGVDTGAGDAGAVYVWATFGVGAYTLSDAQVAWYGNGVGDAMKRAVGAADHDGDGYDDVLIGSSDDDTAASAAGAAYLFFGGPGF